MAATQDVEMPWWAYGPMGMQVSQNGGVAVKKQWCTDGLAGEQRWWAYGPMGMQVRDKRVVRAKGCVYAYTKGVGGYTRQHV